MNRRLTTTLWIAALLLLMGACTPSRVEISREEAWAPASTWERVEPWERGDLASDTMRPDFDPIADADWAHIYFSKEASHGGPGAGGGGCGCN